MPNDELKELFLKLKPVMTIITVRRENEDYALKVSRDIDATYSHTVRILQKMEDMNLIRFEKEGRRKLIYLTKKGEEAAEALHNTWNVLDSID